jgi:hypothetical protein
MEELTIHFPLYKAMMGLSYTVKISQGKGGKKGREKYPTQMKGEKKEACRIVQQFGSSQAKLAPSQNVPWHN